MIHNIFFFLLLEGPETCDRFIAELNDLEEREVTSPGYNSGIFAPNDLFCVYEFVAEVGHRVEVILEVDTESCCDYLRVHKNFIS